MISPKSLLRLVVALAWANVVFAVSGTISDGSLVDGQSFDYVIVGAGLAGLTVANRISASGNKTVLVLEAGSDNRNDDVVTDPYAYSQAFNTDLDYAWYTVGDRVIHGGKTIGGSTSINGMAWTRGEKVQYDALGEKFLSGKGDGRWSWDQLFTQMKKAEDFTAPSSDQQAAGASYSADNHGSSGPIQISYPTGMFTGPQQPAFYDTVSSNFSIPASTDAEGGSAAVVAFHGDSIDPSTQKRSSAATGYWTPIENSRSNIAVLTNSKAVKLNFDNSTTGAVTAQSVTFQNSNTTYTVSASGEIILAAGAIATPVLLQLSGVGPTEILEPIGIDVVLASPGVGKNLQEQTQDSVGRDTNGFDWGGKGPSDVIAYPNFDALLTNNASSIAALINSSISTYAAQAYRAGAVVSTEAGEGIFEIQRDLMINGGVGLVEYFFDTGFPNNGLGIDMWQLLPFSRGSVHIVTRDPDYGPTVDPRYFSAEVDMEIQIAGCRQARKIFQAGSLSQLVTSENAPGYDTVPDNADGGSWDDWKAWIEQGYSSVNHPIGTAAMMDYSLGGVVDENLLVYNTTNLRIVDASVLPLQVSAHLASTLYGIAETAADIINAASS